MKLTSIFQKLYVEVYISIIKYESSIKVTTHILKNNEILDKFEKTFNSKTITNEISTFVESFKAESPYYYISTLDDSKNSYALDSCKKSKVDPSKRSICIDKKFLSLTDFQDLKNIQKDFSSFGLDFIFSPFAILYNVFKDKIDTTLSIYVMISEINLSVMIFDRSKLITSTTLVLVDEASEAIKEIVEPLSLDFDLDSLDENIHLEDIDELDELDELDNLSDDIENLDEIDEIDEFDDKIDIDNKVKTKKDDIDDLNSFSKDFARFTLIQEYLHNFYNESGNDFIENIYILDCFGVSDDLKKYLEEELFLQVTQREIDLADELIKMSIEEIG